MQNQLNRSLADIYKEAVTEAEEALRENYVIRACEKNDDNYPRDSVYSTVWEVSISSHFSYKVIIGIPPTFPDIFPKVFLSTESFRSVKSLPHLDENRFICTIDDNLSIPNKDVPGKVALAVIGKARRIIEEGIQGTNIEDYADEITAYWRLQALNTAISIVDLTDETIKPVLFRLSQTIDGKTVKWKYYDFIIATNKLDARKWIDALDDSVKPTFFSKLLLLKLPSLGVPPFPKDASTMAKLIQSIDPHSFIKLAKYFHETSLPSAVIAEIGHINGTSYCMWIHEGDRKKDKKKILVRGFRPGKAPYYLRLLLYSDDIAVTKVNIERADKERLFSRVGVDTQQPVNTSKVTVVGCGSIGSSLVGILAQAGIGHFNLIDNEKLGAENVARHYCGMADIGLPKVEAIEKKLRSHFPHIEVNHVNDDVLSKLLSDSESLNSSSLIICAVGKYAIERRLNELLKNGSIQSPILFVWVEPLLVAGHALFIKPDNPGCLECLYELVDHSIEYKFRVSVEPQRFMKREAGCQTTFIPYGALEIHSFVNYIAREVLRIIEGRVIDNTAFVWLGDLDAFRKHGHKVSSYWAANVRYSTHEIKLPPSKYCKVCNSEI